MEQHLYLLLDIFTISFPLAASFEKRMHFYTRWKGLFTGILFMACLFLPWDVFFTQWGVWGFNPNYLAGIYFFHLPIEEWLFFLFVPYSCLFIYESLNYYFGKLTRFNRWVRPITLGLATFCLLMAATHFHKLYTLFALGLCGLALLFLYFKNPAWLGAFYRAFLVVQIPFALVNGILTGSGLSEPVVWYNNQQNLHFRLGTIPFEDVFYNMLMLLMVTIVFEQLRPSTENPAHK